MGGLAPGLLLAALGAPPQDGLREAGAAALRVFVREYVGTRFPRLPRDGRQLAQRVYEAPGNLAVVARSLGLDYAVASDAEAPLSSALLALLGAVLEAHGPGRLRVFLDTFLFSATFDTARLVRPRHPVPVLGRALLAQRRPQATFRLLHESGRHSNASMFVVGAFAGPEKLAEGYGASLSLAEHRAATEALRAMHLVDVPDAPRPSDALLAAAAESGRDWLAAHTS